MTITVYTKPSCQPCRATKRKLEDAGITYTEASLEDEGNLAAAKALGHQEAPVVVAGTDHWSGFRPDKINALAERIKETA